MIKQSKGKRESLKARLAEVEKANRNRPRRSLEQKTRVRAIRPGEIIAYDLETTRIKAGTPRPLYLTVYGRGLQIETPIRSLEHLASVLITQVLTPQTYGARFVAWNANRFDAYFIAAALLADPDYRLRPYLTRNKTLRGLRVSFEADGDKRTKRNWEFLDGIAMTGLVGTKLEKFAATFAPQFPKLTGSIDFEREEFDSANPIHRAYAMRDSEALYHGMIAAQQIIMRTFNEDLRATMGGACVRIFQAHIPAGITVDPLIHDVRRVVLDYVMRGGFCFAAKRYHGPVWKYDLNQAYAAAMRDAKLPAGGALHGGGNPRARSGVFIVRLSGTHPTNKIPFYYRFFDSRKISTDFGVNEIRDTWLTSIEYDQLRSEGWSLDCREFYSFGESFSMLDYVDKLERIRTTCDGGPSGAIGTMVKAVGNHSYGKTVEQIDPLEFLLSQECPQDFEPFYADGDAPIDHVYCKIDSDRKAKDYHQPHLGAFITAHVRMIVRRAALIDPAAWLYADTDCVIFSRDVTDSLDIDPRRYGAWKIEEAGTVYRIIAKKVYSSEDGEHRSAKGLHARALTPEHFAAWYEGSPPVQDQVQAQNFLAVLSGAEMFRNQRRQGTRIEAL